MPRELQRDEFETTMNSELVDALSMVDWTLTQVRRDVRKWKWTVLALHNAVTSAMMLALVGTWEFRLMREPYQKKQTKASTVEERFAYLNKPWIKSATEMFASVQNAKVMRMYINSKHYTPEGSQARSFEWLVEQRDSFVHLKPDWRYRYVAT